MAVAPRGAGLGRKGVEVGIQHEIKSDGGVLWVRAWGWDENAQEVQRYGEAIILRARAEKTRLIFCDERELKYEIGTIDTYELADQISHVAPEVSKVAIVCSAACFPDGKFWENVAVNRGLPVRMFVDYEEAARWLLAPG